MRTVVITGANRGIGLGLCIHYLTQGWQVKALCRTPMAAKELAQIERLGCHNQLQQISVDLLDMDSTEQMIKQLKTQCGHIDLLINNAGIGLNQVFGQWTMEGFQQNYMLHTVVPALLIQGLFGQLAEQAKIVQLTSGLASIANTKGTGLSAHFEPYALSKTAVNALSKRLAEKFRDSQLTFCALSPGWVRTQMGGQDAPDSVAEAVLKLSQVIERIGPADSGTYLDENGHVMPW
tara:strand:- start:1684 stop:2388 length:705 start_codon:yes stop_codon:yes gene_type:complete